MGTGKVWFSSAFRACGEDATTGSVARDSVCNGGRAHSVPCLTARGRTLTSGVELAGLGESGESLSYSGKVSFCREGTLSGY